MQANYLKQDYLKTLVLTERVLKLPNLESSLKWDALTLKAKSALAIQDSLTAAETYQKLESAPQSNSVAEAYYFRAFKLHQENQFEASNALIEKIAQLGSASGIWNVKALLLLAKNYFELNDSFQAIFVLESVIENFESYTDEIDEAQRLLEKYKTDEKTSPNENI